MLQYDAGRRFMRQNDNRGNERWAEIGMTVALSWGVGRRGRRRGRGRDTREECGKQCSVVFVVAATALQTNPCLH